MQTARTVRIVADLKTVEKVRELFKLRDMQEKMNDIRTINLVRDQMSQYKENLAGKWTS